MKIYDARGRQRTILRLTYPEGASADITCAHIPDAKEQAEQLTQVMARVYGAPP